MIPIKTIMTKKVLSVQKNTPIYEALNQLTKAQVSGLPVLDNQMKVVGILSEKDVLKILIDKKFDVKNTVDEYMTREVISFTEEDDAIDICKFFLNSHIRRVPIVKDGKLVGIVSRHDIVNLILEAKSKMDDLRFN